MLPSLSRAWRLGLLLLLAVGYVAWHGQEKAVYASTASDDGDDGGGGGDDGGSGDDDDGGDKGTGDDDDDGADKEQPAVTSGGLYTLKTYPINQITRPLTITKGIGQITAALGTDVSNESAFKSVGVNLEGVYGYADNFMLLGGFTSQYSFKQFNIYAGFEGALAYDLLNIRLAARANQFASKDPMDATKYIGGDPKFGIDIGFPFRYQAKPEIAIVALQTLMAVDFNGDAGDPGAGKNTATPDLIPSAGITTNPIPQLNLTIFATLRVIDFNFNADTIQLPATARIQFSPNQKFDIGAEFTLNNLNAPEKFDQRFLSLFIAARVGK